LSWVFFCLGKISSEMLQVQSQVLFGALFPCYK